MSESQIELSLDEEIEISKARTAELVARKNKELIEKRAAALAPVLAAIREHGFTAAELGFATRTEKITTSAPKAERTTVEPRYCDPNGASTWTGRGKTPAWMSAQLADGKTKEDFLIVKPAPEYNVLAGLNVAPAESGEPAGAGDCHGAQPDANPPADNDDLTA